VHYSSFAEKCIYLHDPRVQGDEGSPGRTFTQATSLCKPILIDRLRHVYLNSITQENVLVQDFLWKKRSKPDRDMFEETCNFIANNQEVDVLSGIFNLPFDVPDGIEKLSSVEKLRIALLMHQKSQYHLDFTFSSGSGTFLDGARCMILQTRSFMIESGSGTVEEVPFQSGSPDIITAYEVVFDAKGSTSCKHSLWFDATFEAEKVEVNAVHSKPYVFMQPTDNAKEGYELIDSIKKEIIGRKGGPISSELRERFFILNNFTHDLAWPETEPPSAESSAISKPMANHVNNQYNCKVGNKVKPIWKAFVGCFDDEAPPEGGSRLSVFRHVKDRRSVIFASSLPKLLNDEENIADFLSDYSQ